MKKSIIRKIIALGVVLAMALAFAGCGKGQSAKDAPYSLSIKDAFVCTDYYEENEVLNETLVIGVTGLEPAAS